MWLHALNIQIQTHHSSVQTEAYSDQLLSAKPWTYQSFCRLSTHPDRKPHHSRTKEYSPTYRSLSTLCSYTRSLNLHRLLKARNHSTSSCHIGSSVFYLLTTAVISIIHLGPSLAPRPKHCLRTWRLCRSEWHPFTFRRAWRTQHPPLRHMFLHSCSLTRAEFHRGYFQSVPLDIWL